MQIPQQSLLDQGKITEQIEALKRANPESAIALENGQTLDGILQQKEPVAILSTEPRAESLLRRNVRSA